MLNRTQKSPLRLRPNKIDVDVNRIINRAGKLVMECNQITIENIMQSDKDNHGKVKELLRLSSTKLPKLTSHSKIKKHKYKAVKKQTKKDETIISENKKNNSVYSSFCEDDNSTLLSKTTSEDYNGSNQSCVLPQESLKNKSFPLNIDKEKSQRSHSSSIKSHSSTNRTLDEIMTFTSISPAEINNTGMNKSESSVDNENSQKNHSSSIKSKKSFQLNENRILHEIITFTPISLVEDNEINNTSMNKNESIIMENKFYYEVEVMNGKNDIMSADIDVYIIITGVSFRSNKLFLRQYFMSKHSEQIPFLVGKSDKFMVYTSNYFGAIESIIVGLDISTEDGSWYLENISIKDLFTDESYLFTCRRCLGAEIKEIKLVYTPPYTKSDHSNILSNNDRNNEEDIIQSLSNHFSTEIINEVFQHMETSSQIVDNTKVENIDEDFSKKDYSNDYQINEFEDRILSTKSIHSAVKNKDFKKVKELCSSYESLKCSKDHQGYTPIHIAAKYYENSYICREIIYFLLSLNVDIDSKSADGYTPFLLAVKNDNIESVKYLKSVLNVNLFVKDLEDNTALHLAALNNCDEIVKYILPEYGDIYMKNKLGETPFDIAQKNNNVNLIKLFSQVTSQNINESEKGEVISQRNKATTIVTIEAPLDQSVDVNNVESKGLEDVSLNDDNENVLRQRSRAQSKHLSNHIIHNSTNKEIQDNDDTEEKHSEFEKANQNNTFNKIYSDSLNNEEFDDDNQGIQFTKSFNLKRKESKLNIAKLRNVQFADSSSSISDSSNRATSPISSRPSSSLTIRDENSSSISETSVEGKIKNKTSHDDDWNLSITKDSEESKTPSINQYQKNFEDVGISDSNVLNQETVDKKFKDETFDHNEEQLLQDNSREIENSVDEEINLVAADSHILKENYTNNEFKEETSQNDKQSPKRDNFDENKSSFDDEKNGESNRTLNSSLFQEKFETKTTHNENQSFHGSRINPKRSESDLENKHQSQSSSSEDNKP